MKLKGKKDFKTLTRKIYRGRELYLMLALPLLYLIIFSYVPMAGLQIAFKDYTFKGGIWGSEWVGFKHFKKFFSDRNFSTILINTLRVSVYSLAVNTFIPIILALSLNCLKHNKLKKLVQTLTYLPHFISVVVLIGMMTQMLNPIVGVYGNIVQAITGERAVDILGIPSAFPHLYVWSGAWQNAGFNSIIYIAALAGSDQSLHEAAQIDGASRLQRVRYIDMYLNDKDLYPLQIFLKNILVSNQVEADMIVDAQVQSQEGIAEVLKYSLIVVAVIPVMIIYPFVQKHFVKGVMIGAVKG